jgi:hypothetical protein
MVITFRTVEPRPVDLHRYDRVMRRFLVWHPIHKHYIWAVL